MSKDGHCSILFNIKQFEASNQSGLKTLGYTSIYNVIVFNIKLEDIDTNIICHLLSICSLIYIYYFSE